MLAPWAQSFNMIDDEGEIVPAIIAQRFKKIRNPYRDRNRIACGMFSIATAILKTGGYDKNGQPLKRVELACMTCGEYFTSARSHALTCSARCRKRLERMREKLHAELRESSFEIVSERLTVDEEFAEALRLIALADGYGRDSAIDARAVKRAVPLSPDYMDDQGITDNFWSEAA